MKLHSRVALSIIGVLALGLSGEVAIAQDLPTVKGKKIVASVNNEPITLDELNQEVAYIEREMAPGQKIDKREELEVLKRMITTRLIVQEAKNIGLDKLPEVTMMVDSFSKDTLREELAQKIIKDVKVDEKEVEKIYKESVREWRISAVLCEKEEDAKSIEGELKSGKDFGEVTKTFVSERRANKGEEGVYVRVKDVDPQVGKVAASMAVGATSSIIHTKSGFVILKLEDIRYQESPEEKENARRIALAMARGKALKVYEEGLVKKYVSVNRDILNSIDYEAETPGFEALLKDTRIIAEVKGDKPVSVGEMTQELRYQFYHGVQGAAERKRLNAKKDVVLEGLLHRKVFRNEALRLGVDKTESYRSKVRDYGTSVVFGMFINKVIVTEIKMKEDELKAFYIDHLKDYATPEMTKIKSLAFAKRGDAENAIEKLKAGAEFQWLAAHADGQADTNAKGLLSFDGRPIITNDLPGGVRKAIAGSKAGDSRLYASPEGDFYVFVILDVVPSTPQAYEQVRQEIAERLFKEMQKRAVEEYADKLRSLSEVKVFFKN